MNGDKQLTQEEIKNMGKGFDKEIQGKLTKLDEFVKKEFSEMDYLLLVSFSKQTEKSLILSRRAQLSSVNENTTSFGVVKRLVFGAVSQFNHLMALYNIQPPMQVQTPQPMENTEEVELTSVH